jgi:methionyl-tRNA synthetase
VSDAFYLTTPIYYVNARPHLGHAYTTILADAMARYHRLRGDRVFFLTGTDEHGDNIAQAAASAGVAPRVYVDDISAAFRDTWRRLGISNDDFIRTTEERHETVVRAILQRLWDRGEIYFGKYGGQYCFGCERFYTDKEIVDGKCPDHQRPLTYIEEENYFFKMSKYQDWLIRYIEDRPDLIRPERYRNEILGFLREPLHDLSISRPRTRLEWGIPLPFDDRFVTYVWFDALLNYVSALGPLEGPEDGRYRTFWPVVQHLIGKDILKPHGVYWPCMLKAADLPVYTHLNVHGFWGLGGGKMSKSVGNVVEALALADRYGHDAFRYFLMRDMVFGLDADFSEEALVGRLNADLANDLGNLVSRATTLIANAGGAVPSPAGGHHEPLARAYATARAEVDRAMAEFAFHRALGAIWAFIAEVNRFVDATEPWRLGKDPQRVDELHRVLFTLGEAVRCIAVILAPFLPQASARILTALGQPAEPCAADLEWRGQGGSARAQRLSGLFPRIEPARAGAAPPARDAAADGGAGLVTIADFGRLDLRVAEVIAAEAVPKSRKLLKLTVSLGTETRTVAAGIAEHYAPADLVGKKIVVVANLQPATLMGVESQGMLLAGSAGDRLAVVLLDRDLPAGAKVK